ncbi:hypothetical protein LKO27_13045 [Tessaracoccus sp. OS52]|uniref:hypothetical protein n=1 Tax=Tessaracoccus sp. OS52 TaxID=2886691 RepID=UPI001D0F791B|nr:hypothetical protein [Tessaracoccus sp. OS52]MCC2594332.1 hypothetical protein [Tessaracoccus sp. OS52]
MSDGIDRAEFVSEARVSPVVNRYATIAKENAAKPVTDDARAIAIDRKRLVKLTIPFPPTAKATRVLLKSLTKSVFGKVA